MNSHPPHPNHPPYPPPPPPGHHQRHPHPHPHHPSHNADYQQTAAAALSSGPPPPPPQAAQVPTPLSQHHIPTPNNTATPNGRKRKAGAPGSRGVANLTPEQLAKKRANDREAQRAIRERTKNTIEGLEARIRELESQQPYQELQRALADRDRALQECEQLKTRLAAVAGIVGNRELGQTGLNGMNSPAAATSTSKEMLARALLTTDGPELAALTAQQSPLPSTAGHSTPSHYPQHQPPPAQQYENVPPQQHLHPDLRSPNTPSTAGSPAAGHTPHYQGSEGHVRKWSQGADSPAQHPHHQYTSHGMSYDQQQNHQQHQQSQHQHPHQHQHQHQQHPAPPAQMQQQGESNGERLGLNFLLEQQHSSPLAKPTGSLPNNNNALPNDSQNAAMAVQILRQHKTTCPLDYLLGETVHKCRAQLADGASISDVIGPEKPSLLSLTQPEANRSQSDHLTPLLLDILSKFPSIDRDPDRIAVLFGMYYILRWFICPCQACLERCPPWQRPLDEACSHPHAVWIDYLPWPEMRRKLILGRTPGTSVEFGDFFVPFTYTMSVNWPYSQDASSCLKTTPGDPPVVELDPSFEEHIRRLENWTLGSEFRKRFPELVDQTVRIKDRENMARIEDERLVAS